MIATADNPNIAILELAVRALGELTDSLVFVGGCATGLLVTKTRANQIRATEDVDVVAQAATIGEYHRVKACWPHAASSMTPHRTRRSAVG